LAKFALAIPKFFDEKVVTIRDFMIKLINALKK